MKTRPRFYFSLFHRLTPWDRRKSGAGFTLFELLITISIMGIIVIVIGTLFISTGQFNIDEQVRIDVGEDASRVLGPLDQALREGEQIQTSAIISGTTYTYQRNDLYPRHGHGCFYHAEP